MSFLKLLSFVKLLVAVFVITPGRENYQKSCGLTLSQTFLRQVGEVYSSKVF